MGRWTGKYAIGLTGNIATGKSVVRRMLEHLGAFGIDADGLSHQAMSRGGPAYADVVRTFGELVVGADGQIDRQTLGNIVFANPAALARLEAIVHPIVRQAVDILAARAPQPVIVIEAIKLLEGELASACDSIWVVNAPDEARIARLMRKRGLTADQARARMSAQPPQAEKLKRAAVVIENGGSFEETWTQVVSAWSSGVPAQMQPPEAEAETNQPTSASAAQARPALGGAVTVRRGKPSDAAVIAAFITNATHSARRMTREDVMAAFGQKAYLLAQVNNSVSALAGWQVENLVTRVDDLYLSNGISPDLVIEPLLESIESASRDLQSEASFLFVPPGLSSSVEAVFEASGYEVVLPDGIGITAWREAIKESQPPGTIIFFKRLREDRVLRPV